MMCDTALNKKFFPTEDRASRDREVIRIDHFSDSMGIAAALRRAFAEASAPGDRDFDELLLRLN